MKMGFQGKFKDGREFVFGFEHKIVKYKKGDRMRTRCALAVGPDGAIVRSGYAECSRKDCFKKETGRKMALTNALKKKTLTKEDRTEIWRVYFDRLKKAPIAQRKWAPRVVEIVTGWTRSNFSRTHTNCGRNFECCDCPISHDTGGGWPGRPYLHCFYTSFDEVVAHLESIGFPGFEKKAKPEPEEKPDEALSEARESIEKIGILGYRTLSKEEVLERTDEYKRSPDWASGPLWMRTYRPGKEAGTDYTYRRKIQEPEPEPEIEEKYIEFTSEHFATGVVEVHITKQTHGGCDFGQDGLYIFTPKQGRRLCSKPNGVSSAEFFFIQPQSKPNNLRISMSIPYFDEWKSVVAEYNAYFSAPEIRKRREAKAKK